jgi:hypothetical protein
MQIMLLLRKITYLVQLMQIHKILVVLFLEISRTIILIKYLIKKIPKQIISKILNKIIKEKVLIAFLYFQIIMPHKLNQKNQKKILILINHLYFQIRQLILKMEQDYSELQNKKKKNQKILTTQIKPKLKHSLKFRKKKKQIIIINPKIIYSEIILILKQPQEIIIYLVFKVTNLPKLKLSHLKIIILTQIQILHLIY